MLRLLVQIKANIEALARTHAQGKSQALVCSHVPVHKQTLELLHPRTGREVREQCLEEVTDLLHDLDEGMLPVSVMFPYLPIPAHFRRDK
eukprot:1152307-Pelagomonas_calceolata.AAC.4